MFCPQCGGRLDDKARFCPKCGTPLGDTSAASSVKLQSAPSGNAAPSDAATVRVAGGARPGKRCRALGVVVASGSLVAVACAAFLVWTLFFAPYPIDEKTFPDGRVRSYVADVVDSDGDGRVSREEAAAVEAIEVDGAVEVNGLGLFPNLRTVQVTGDALSSVDVAGAKLLSEIDVTGCAGLTELKIGDCPELRSLLASGTNLEKLDVSGAPNLEKLAIKNTGIAFVDVSKNAGLKLLRCDDDVEVQGLLNTPLKTHWVVARFEASVAEHPPIAGSYNLFSIVYDDENRLSNQSVSCGQSKDDPLGAVSSISYEYDGSSRLPENCVSDDPAAMTQGASYDYNAQGLLSKVSAGSETLLVYAYDEAGRIAGVSGELRSAQNTMPLDNAYLYDAGGRLERIETLQGQVLFEYDEAGLVVNVTRSGGGSTVESYSFEYDGSGKCSGMQLETPNGTLSEAYVRDSDGRIVSASRTTLPGSNGFSYSYPEMEASFEYDGNGNLSSCVFARNDGASDVYSIEYERLYGSDEYAPEKNDGVKLGSPLQPKATMQPWMPDWATDWGMLVEVPDPVKVSLL